jgi:hypothetical protein
MKIRIISLLLLAILSFSLLAAAAEGEENLCVETASMHVERTYHTATLLNDGKVLVAGGMHNSSMGYVGTDICELYDPSADTWSVTDSLHNNRYAHTATLLNNGKVLVVGGMRSVQQGVASTCELYDPATGSWDLTTGLSIGRYHHTATLLPDGRVLVAGGDRGGARVLECELFDPATGLWAPTGALNEARYSATSALLPDGMVLIAGGLDESSSAISTCELYNQSTGTWRYTRPMNEVRAWTEYGAVLLRNGSILIVGGGDGFNSLTSCELYDPSAETWTVTGSLNYVSWGITTILLPNGQVLALDWCCYMVYNPETGVWAMLGQALYGRVAYTATLLADGRVLVTGGLVPQPTASCELFNASAAIPEFPSFSLIVILAASAVGAVVVVKRRFIRSVIGSTRAI